MKKSIFSLAFLFLIIVTCSNVYSQSLSSLLKLNLAEESEVSEQKDKLAVVLLSDEEKKDESNTTEGISRKADETTVQPSSSRISIGIGKALFEKYIK